MQGSLLTLFNEIEAHLDDSKDEEAEGDQISSDCEDLDPAIDVMADSEDQIAKEIRQKLKDLVKIFNGPSHFFIDISNHDRAARLLRYLYNNVKISLDIIIGQKHMIDNLYENLTTLITNYCAVDKFLRGLSEKDVKK